MTDENLPASSSRNASGAWLPPSIEDIQALFPQYEIVSLLGRGGMGAVFKGWQRSLERFVAIKILPPGRTDESQYAERFKQEARSMAKLSHPGIVAVFDAGETSDGMLYFVMEFIEGTDVQKMIAEQGCLPPAHAMAITAHVCDALQYAHDRNIIHRDIKPANIMVGFNGVVKVADFGLAKQHQEGVSGITQSGMMMGTLHYMAPESLILGVSVDHRADIYAVGIMLYQMLTGRLPQGLFEMPSQKVPGLDPSYDAAVSKAIREDRDIRYQSAAELRADLDSILTQPVARVDPAATQAPAALPTVARPRRPQGYVQREPQPVQKKSSPSGMLLAAVLVLAGVALFLFKDKLLPEASTHLSNTEATKSDAVIQLPGDEASPKEGAEQVPSIASANAGKSAIPGTMPTAPQKAETAAPAPAGPQTEIQKRVAFLEAGFQSAVKGQPEQTFRQNMAALDKSYQAAVERALAAATREGRLEDAVALRAEKQRVENERGVPSVLEEATLISPVIDDLKKLRETYRRTQMLHATTKAQAVAALYDKYDQALLAIQTELTKVKKLDDALQVKPVRDAISRRKAEMLAMTETSAAAAPKTVAESASGFTNSLGMKFVPIPDTDILMCIHETRRQDYAAFAAQVPDLKDYWKKQLCGNLPCGDKDDHPVVGVSWQEAKQFCDWLSQKEERSYRLPKDEEWSKAVGVARLESRSPTVTLDMLSQKEQTHFPWGGQFPLQTSDRAGNYADNTWHEHFPDKPYFENYTDGYATTAPVGSFKPNKLGLYDMGGNVWEWVEEWRNAERKEHVNRGGGFFYNGGRGNLLSSVRGFNPAEARYMNTGFRVVVKVTAAAPVAPSISTSEPVSKTLPTVTSSTPPKSDRGADQSFTNTLGMKFVPVPQTDILMCIHETRRQDYAMYANEAGAPDDRWKKAKAAYHATSSGHEDNHPVVAVEWEHAVAFCDWLSKKEGRVYKLPSDWEWSMAVGLKATEGMSRGRSPASLNGGTPDHYPWGSDWPPPPRAGNFTDLATWKDITDPQFPKPDYYDGFPTTAPVMSFRANSLGIFDLAGNVAEWCEDWYDESRTEHLLRGSAWYRRLDSKSQNSSFREHVKIGVRNDGIGFRVAVKIMASAEGGAPAATSATAPKSASVSSAPAPVFTNTLGMKFVPVPGIRVQMCIHETRCKDYAAYSQKAVTGAQEDHPIANVSWDDAKAFCDWLSRTENRIYRLPTDEEWSYAAGIGTMEIRSAGMTPEILNQKETTTFPWGGAFPPTKPGEAGNIADAVWHEKWPKEPWLEGYTDGFVFTAPVMSFQPNSFGIYDLSGNVSEWVEDWFNADQKRRVWRGSSCAGGTIRTSSLSSHRSSSDAASRSGYFGFRCVLETEAATKPVPSGILPPSEKATAAVSAMLVPEAVLFGTTGQVSVIGRDGEAKVGGIALPQGAPVTTVITPGSVVKTGAASSADLALAGGGSVRIEADSEFKLSEEVSGNAPSESLELHKGRVFMCLDAADLAKTGRTEIRLKTPAASISVRGARFYVEIGDTYETIGVFKGSVEVTETKLGGKIIVKDDMNVAVKAGTLSPPRRLGMEQAALRKICDQIELVRTESSLLQSDDPTQGTLRDLYFYENSNNTTKGFASFEPIASPKSRANGTLLVIKANDQANVRTRTIAYEPRVEVPPSQVGFVAVESAFRSDGIFSVRAGFEGYIPNKEAIQIMPGPKTLRLKPGDGAVGTWMRKMHPLFPGVVTSSMKYFMPSFHVYVKISDVTLLSVVPGKKEYRLEISPIIIISRKQQP